jgi:uncharacterized protein (DUF736 family)
MGQAEPGTAHQPQDHDMAFYCRVFYDSGSAWVTRMKEKGRRFIDLHLKNRQIPRQLFYPLFRGCLAGGHTAP